MPKAARSLRRPSWQRRRRRPQVAAAARMPSAGRSLRRRQTRRPAWPAGRMCRRQREMPAAPAAQSYHRRRGSCSGRAPPRRRANPPMRPQRRQRDWRTAPPTQRARRQRPGCRRRAMAQPRVARQRLRVKEACQRLENMIHMCVSRLNIGSVLRHNTGREKSRQYSTSSSEPGIRLGRTKRRCRGRRANRAE